MEVWFTGLVQIQPYSFFFVGVIDTAKLIPWFLHNASDNSSLQSICSVVMKLAGIGGFGDVARVYQRLTTEMSILNASASSAVLHRK
jgi:hypothetical protein